MHNFLARKGNLKYLALLVLLVLGWTVLVSPADAQDVIVPTGIVIEADTDEDSMVDEIAQLLIIEGSVGLLLQPGQYWFSSLRPFDVRGTVSFDEMTLELTDLWARVFPGWVFPYQVIEEQYVFFSAADYETVNFEVSPTEAFCQMGTTEYDEELAEYQLSWNSKLGFGWMGGGLLSSAAKSGSVYCRVRFPLEVTLLADSSGSTHSGVDGVVGVNIGLEATGVLFEWVFPSASDRNWLGFRLQ